MKKIILFLSLILLILTGCTRNTVTVYFDVSEHDVDVVQSIEVVVGEVIPLPNVNEAWFELDGWYMESDHTVKADGIIAQESITIYGLFKPSLSIAIIGNDAFEVHQLVFSTVSDYALEHNRIYKVYNQEVGNFIDTQADALELIHEAVNDGADLIFLTLSWRQSEAVHEAQTLYPNIRFVLFDDTPKADYFFGPSHIAENTLSIRTPFEIYGFLAGYAAVINGQRNLGFYGDDGERSFSSGIGFISGAYYAANELNVSIQMNNDTYKVVSQATTTTFYRFYNSLYQAGTEVIYTRMPLMDGVMENIAEYEDKYLILGYENSINSNALLASVFRDVIKTTATILENYFDHQLDGGDFMSYYSEIELSNSNLSGYTLTEQNQILLKLEQGIITVPQDYDALMTFLDALDSADGVQLEKDIIEGIQPY